MEIKPAVLLAIVLIGSSGCGSKVPDLTPSGEDQLFVEDVHMAIRCELIEAIHETNRQAAAIASLRTNTSDFFDSWGVKYTLTLQVVENFSANASLAGTSNPTPNLRDTVATVSAGPGMSTKATRTETDQSFSTIKLYSLENPCSSELNNKIVPNGRDLGLGSWLRTRLSLVDRGIIGSITETESFTYEVQFEIARTANISPIWMFIQRNLSSVSTPLAGGRSTKHSVLVTFGPTNAARTRLAEDAAAVHDASLISTAINR